MSMMRMVFLAACVFVLASPTASAESLTFRVPAELAPVPMPPLDAERNAARDVRVSRHEAQSGRGMLRIIFADLPINGRLGTESVGTIARGTSASVGGATCVEHSASEVREFVIDGRDAAEFTLVCRGLIVGGSTEPQTINVRRTVLVRGETRFYNFQADEYAPMATLDAAASAARWDEVVASLRWCADGAACEAR